MIWQSLLIYYLLNAETLSLPLGKSLVPLWPYFSSMYSQIAIDSVIVYPSMSKTGTCCIGFIAVISSPFCSPLRRLTALYSKSRPLRLRTILSLQELPDRQYPWRAIFGVGLVEKQESSTAGNTFPLQSPNPIVYPFPWQKPIKLISSPFYKNFLTSPVGKSIG